MFAKAAVRLSAPWLVCSSVLSQGQLWVVDKSGGPGVNFVEIQPAISAAGEGDTIVIRGSPSPYLGFLIDGKSLVVKEEEGHTVAVGNSNVRNISAAQSVTLRGLLISHLRLETSPGTILLEELGYPSPGGVCGGSPSEEAEVEVVSCGSVVLSRCNLQGSNPGPGVPALTLSNSTVHAYETGAAGSSPTTPSTGLDGGSGVMVTNSFLFVSGGRFFGGCGVDASTATCTGSAGDGGPGLASSGSSSVYLLEAFLFGGFGGISCSGGGSWGQPWTGVSPTLVAGYARNYAISSLASGGSTASIDYDGIAGDLVFSLVALDVDPLFVLGLAGTLVPAIPPILVPHGPADASGNLAASVPLPALPPGIEAFAVHAQGAALSAVGAAVLAAPSHLTIR